MSAIFKTDREAWTRRMEERRQMENKVRAVYEAHMSKAAHHLFLAGECVKRGEHGTALAQHKLAQMNLDAATKAIPQ